MPVKHHQETCTWNFHVCHAFMRKFFFSYTLHVSCNDRTQLYSVQVFINRALTCTPNLMVVRLTDAQNIEDQKLARMLVTEIVQFDWSAVFESFWY